MNYFGPISTEEWLHKMQTAKLEEAGGVWRTVHGRHIFIKEGQSVEDALGDDDQTKSLERVVSSSNSNIKIAKEGSDEADEIEEIFKQEGINVSGIRQPLFAYKDGDKTIGGIMADFDGDMKIDIAVSGESQGKGIGQSLIERSVRYYEKNLDSLAEKSDVLPEDYNLIVLPISEKMGPMLKRAGFVKDGEEYVLTQEALKRIKK